MRIILLAILSLLVSCGVTSTTYNPTVYEYGYDEEAVKTSPIKKIVLAPVSLGAPPPSYLRKGDRKIKALVSDYLKSNGYEILPAYHFENAWKQAARTYGNIHDPSTGKVDINAWKGAMVTAGEILREQTDADAIVFADIFEHKVQHSSSMQHYARWYGVSRKPAFKGRSDGIPAGFEWTKEIAAASVLVTIYDVNLKRLFSSRGGIDTLYAVSLKSANPTFVRRKKLLDNNDHIEEGIELAFHPFIPMKKYPGNP